MGLFSTITLEHTAKGAEFSLISLNARSLVLPPQMRQGKINSP